MSHLVNLARALVAAFYRRVEVRPRPLGKRDGPEIVVANHFGGLGDILLLLAISEETPRFIARDVIWRIPIARSVMKAVRAIPVRRRADGPTGPGGNDDMFATCYEALAAGDRLLIFPEGITRDDPSIGRVKTGAARIALGARESGTTGIRVTPVGIHYEDKAALRSRVSVHVGASIDLDDAPSEVAELTAEIDAALRSVAPDFADWEEARALSDAAEVVLRSRQVGPTVPVSIGLRDRLASLVATTPQPQRAAVVEAAERYRADLDELGLDDEQVEIEVPQHSVAWTALRELMLSVVLLPFAVVGLVINWLPALIVWAIGRFRLAPAVQATLKPAVAVVAFGAAWTIAAWQVGRAFGFGAALIAVLLMPVYVAGLILLTERLVLTRRAIRAWWRRRKHPELRHAALSDRRQLIESVRSAFV